MIKVSKLADYAVVVLATLNECDVQMTAPLLARETGLPEPTVAKVLKLLGTGNFVTSTRGANGGYRLAVPFETLTIAHIITAIDGPIALTACVDGQEGCGFQGGCAVRGRWNQVNRAVNETLAGILLRDMMKNDKRAA
ncbi:MAG: SUF system Fe-S cluster assembly regulator [Alphaproteobacteria bacterium]